MESLEFLKAWINDPKNLEEMASYFRKKEEKKRKNMERMKVFYSDDISFNVLVDRIVKKHDERWSELCYKNGVMPYPWLILQAIYDIAQTEGEEVRPVDGLTRNFPSMLCKYRGLTFAITHGQGSVLSIFRGKKLIYRD